MVIKRKASIAFLKNIVKRYKTVTKKAQKHIRPTYNLVLFSQF